jgi:hypothetical protein
MLLAASFFAIAQAATAAPPDIELNARVRAREVRIEQQGRAEARVHVEPSAGQRIDVERNLPKGQASYRNLDIKVNVAARLADPAAPGVSASASAQTEPATGD